MKMIVFFRRKATLTAEQFRQHYETRHAPLALSLFPYIKAYRRNYIRHDMRHQRAGGEAVNTGFGFDVITEIVFASEADYLRMKADMNEPAIREKVIEDELRFIDRSATVVLIADEEDSLLPATGA